MLVVFRTQAGIVANKDLRACLLIYEVGVVVGENDEVAWKKYDQLAKASAIVGLAELGN